MSRPAVDLNSSPLIVDFPERPQKMTAAVLSDYGPSSNLKVQLCDLPRLPMGRLRPTEVVVEVYATSVNPTDWKMRKGTLSKISPLSLPTILGIDFSGDWSKFNELRNPIPMTGGTGRVVRAGEQSKVSAGDEVFGRQTLPRMQEVNGAYAEYIIVDSADLAVKPRSISHDEAAAVPQVRITHQPLITDAD